MNIGTIRALILAANLALLGLIGYALYEAFYDIDPSQSESSVKEPKWDRYALPDISEDDKQKQQAAYKVISKAFDPPPPPPAPVVKNDKPIEPPTADLSRLQIVLVSVSDEHPEMSQVCITGPLAETQEGAKAQRFFGPGAAIDTKGLGLEAYKGAKVKSITEEEVIFVDSKGKEVHVPCPKPAPPPIKDASRTSKP